MTGDEVTKENMCYPHISDIGIASMVRMLMRHDLDHEIVCVAARDRIMYLSQQLAKQDFNTLIARAMEAADREGITLKVTAYPIKKNGVKP